MLSQQTHTMMGPDIDDGMAKGIIPRLVEAIFSQIEASPETLEFAIKVSFMEIYMERIRDLLNPANDNLPIHEEKGRGVFVKGMMEIYVGQISEVLDIMKRGLLNRAVAYTNMNEASSRSHSIFVITVQCKNTKDGSNRIGRLYLVDLAGSEKIKKTDVSGQTLEEAKKINKSLSSLGMVINALTDGKVRYLRHRSGRERLFIARLSLHSRPISPTETRSSPESYKNPLVATRKPHLLSAALPLHSTTWKPFHLFDSACARKPSRTKPVSMPSFLQQSSKLL